MRAVNSAVLAVNSAVFSEILASIKSFSSWSVVASDFILSPSITPFNFRISPFRIFRVSIASQFLRFAESFKSRSVKSGFPNAKGMFKKQYFIPLLSQAHFRHTFFKKSVTKFFLFWNFLSRNRWFFPLHSPWDFILMKINFECFFGLFDDFSPSSVFGQFWVSFIA